MLWVYKNKSKENITKLSDIKIAIKQLYRLLLIERTTRMFHILKKNEIFCFMILSYYDSKLTELSKW